MADAWYKVVILIGNQHRGWHITSWIIFSCLFNIIGTNFYALITLAQLDSMIRLILEYTMVIFGIFGFILMRLAFFLNQSANMPPAEIQQKVEDT
jgi:hypothetical protein